MKKTTLTMIGLLALALGGCATHSIAYRTGLNGGGKVTSERESYFLWGLAGGKTLKLDEICPAGVSTVKNRHTFGDQILAALTAGLYSPMTVTVECSGGEKAGLLVTPAE